jgi:hypothetical protein
VDKPESYYAKMQGIQICFPDLESRMTRSDKFVAVGCRSLDCLREWFTRDEFETLKKYGFMAVRLKAKRIIAECETQLVFARPKPMTLGCVPVDLYRSRVVTDLVPEFDIAKIDG